jgi:IS5 family transposase
MSTRKNRPQPSFFDVDNVYSQISKMGDTFETLNATVDWEIFRPTLNAVFVKEAKGPGGRPPYDYVLMFKILILQQVYNLSDERTQYDILNRLDFRRFLGLDFCDTVPDEKTIWAFREQLAQSAVIFELFDVFKDVLKEKGLILKGGAMIDATIIPAPIQHMTKEEKEALSRDEEPESWQQKPAVKRQRDTDASWTKKNSRSYFGYKNHIKASEKSKLIETFEVTISKVHDSQPVGILLEDDDTGREVYADSAYASSEIKGTFRKRGIKYRIHQKAYRNKPLTESAKRTNRKKSKIRARVEHVFGAIRMRMHNITVRAIGLTRAAAIIGLRNIVYNMHRLAYLERTP